MVGVCSRVSSRKGQRRTAKHWFWQMAG